MINQVIIAGRLLDEPRAEGMGCALRLELARPARGGSGGPEAPVVVRAVALDERRAASLQKYLRQGRDVLIHGHLQEDAGGVCVAVDTFEFMEDGLTTGLLGRGAERPAWVTARPATKPAAATPAAAKPAARARTVAA